MEVQQVLHMNGGEGETSYANNSNLQKRVISKVKPLLEELIKNLCHHNTFSSHCLRIADLGCSSGPNTLLVITEIIDITHRICRQTPGFHVFLNDLPKNDFNSVFRSLPGFYDKLKNEKGYDVEQCFITGVPGSFYNRLFPNNTLDFVHSSYSLHYISQVPPGLEDEAGIPLNKGNIYIARTSPQSVHEAYQNQFKKNFSSFLMLRSDELVSGGHMLLTFMCRKSDDPLIEENCTPWKLLASTLMDMVREGLVEEAKLDYFNVPYYAASVNEIRDLIQAEGSFKLNRLESFEINWDAALNDCNENFLSHELRRGECVARSIRVVAQPILVSHFGEAIMDDLFRRFTVKIIELLREEEAKYVNVVVSLTKKD